MTKNAALAKIIDRAFDRCNLIGEDCDIYSVLYSYKSIAKLSQAEIDEIYNCIAFRMGFCN